MAEVVDFVDKVKRYYKFSIHELRGMVIAIVIVAFVVSFKEWGGAVFNLSAGLFNLFNALLIVALSFLVHDAGQRMWALMIGYRIEYKMWTFGLIAALVLAFMTNGNIWLIVPGGFMIHHLAGHRLGWFRYGINIYGQGMVALAGPLFTFMLIIFLKILFSVAPNPLLEKAILFNVVYLITSMLPIPPLDGSKIFMGSRITYAFVFPALVTATILLIINIPLFFSLILSFLIGIILWITYYITFERKAWTGPK